MTVLDTNVVSELMRSVPDPRVVSWVRRQRASDLVTTAVTVAEVRYGIARLPLGRRRDDLSDAAEGVFAGFPEAVLPFDVPAAASYAEVVTVRERAGHPISVFDAQIAAICRTHDQTLATRNTDDFAGTGVVTVDPWADA